MKLSLLNLNKLSILIFLIISLILVLITFSDKKMVAGGEEGMFMYNPVRSLELYSSPWFETGTGYPVSFFLPRINLLIASILLTNLGISIWMIQALLFFFLFFFAMYYVYLLTGEVFTNKNRKLMGLLAGIFYLLNLYSLSQVWGRFLHAQFFTFTLLPIFTYYFIRFINRFKISDIILLNFFSLLCSFAFGMPAQIITVWSPAFLYFLIVIFKNRNNTKKILRSAGIFLIVVFSWVIVNIWWIYPSKELINNTFADIAVWKVNFDSLKGVSKYFSTDQIILLRQGFLFGEGSGNHSFYSHPFIYILSIAILILMVYGLIKSKKEKNWLFLSTLLFLGWFISKGSNFPLGSTFYQFLFSNFPFSQVLRNPYEKFGLVWLLAYSFFFAAGLTYFIETIRGEKRYALALFLMFLFSVILVWPLWRGDFLKSLKIDIPTYYRDVNELIKSDHRDGRILVLPIHKGDSSLLNWGYSGVESSEYFFSNPTISKTLELSKTFNLKYNQLVDEIDQGDNLTQFFEEFNIEYIVVHYDLKLERNQNDADIAEEKISKIPGINFIRKIGELTLYKYQSNKLGYFVTDNNSIELTYKKLSPTKYLVDVKNSTKPFKLIFKETYDNKWEAKNADKLFSHFKAYNYANGWEVNKTGDYQIQIAFKVWPWE